MSYPKQRPEAEIPTSSLADVAFLLIVFFVITQTMASNRGLDFGLSEDPGTAVVDPVESVHVRISPDSSLVVDGKTMNNGDLMEYLGPRLRANPGKPVILQADGKAPYGSMVATYDLLRGADRRLGLEQEIDIVIPTRAQAAMLGY